MAEAASTQRRAMENALQHHLMCFAATFVCYIDRVNISVAIIPMAEEFKWDLETQGIILSSFYVGYMIMQVLGGFLADRFGGKIVLGLGVLIWSFFTIVTPWAAFSGMLGLLIARIGMGLVRRSLSLRFTVWLRDGFRCMKRPKRLP